MGDDFFGFSWIRIEPVRVPQHFSIVRGNIAVSIGAAGNEIIPSIPSLSELDPEYDPEYDPMDQRMLTHEAFEAWMDRQIDRA
jgi:hypothetical protein